jgi:acetyl-CoA synthetase
MTVPVSQQSSTENYRAVRDRLLELRGAQSKAIAEFGWPDLGETFNWSVDWFEEIAPGNDALALVIVEEDATTVERPFAQMSHASDQVAAWLASKGVRRGDSVLLMLGNQVELWESMLAIMKLGAVIMPTTTAVGPADLIDRLDRGAARHILCNARDVEKFSAVHGDYSHLSVGPAPGWDDLRAAYDIVDPSVEYARTAPDDRLLLYFTSGTTSRPKLVEHTHVSYPVGHMATMYWIGLRPGDVHLNISSPGWAKHAWSCFFAPWIAESTILIYNYSRFDAAALLAQLRTRHVTSFCAPPTVWRMMINADLSDGPGDLREAVSAGEPLNPEVIAQVQPTWGITIRDGFGQTETCCQIGNPPGEAVKAGSMGRPLPGVPVVLVDPLTSEKVEGIGEGEICLELIRRPLSLMVGYLDDPQRNGEAMAGGYYHTGDIAIRDAQGYLTFGVTI